MPYCFDISHCKVSCCFALLYCNLFSGELTHNPNYNITSFDNIIFAWLTIFTCITLEGWTEVMYWLVDSRGWWSVSYFFLLIFVGSFFVVQLVVAVIHESYTGTETGSYCFDISR